MKTIILDYLLNRKIISAALMIAGTAIGAGMLGIPLVSAEVGFLSSVVVTLLVWMYMLITGLFLMEVSVSLKEKGGFTELAEKYLPPFAKSLVTFLFIFLYGILLVAYVSAGSAIFGVQLSNSFGVKCLFPLLITALLFLRTKKVVTLISLLTIPMWVYFAFFYVLGASHVDISRLSMEWSPQSYLVIPVLFGAFGYHNVIPSITSYLDYNKRDLKVAIIMGSLIPCVLYLLWQFLILGMVDTQTLSLAREKGIPVVALLGNITQNSLFGNAGAIFAFFAILTSALGVGLSVVRFIDEKERGFVIASVIAIPTVIAFTYPGLFLGALNLAGGVGESILNGIIPVWLYLMYKISKKDLSQKVKVSSFFLLLIALFVVMVEIGNIG
jgi:tyrosine-specific transport protein